MLLASSCLAASAVASDPYQPAILAPARTDLSVIAEAVDAQAATFLNLSSDRKTEMVSSRRPAAGALGQTSGVQAANAFSKRTIIL